MAKRYTAEEKKSILTRVEEVGVKKACEEFGVNAQSIYKWKRDAAPETPAESREDKPDMADLLSPVPELEARIKALEEENAMLRNRNEKLRNLLISLADAI